MLLCRNKVWDYKNLISTGLVLYALGMLGVSSSFILKRFANPAGSTDFLEGFLLGLGLVLVVASIVFNVKGLREWRLQKNGK